MYMHTRVLSANEKINYNIKLVVRICSLLSGHRLNVITVHKTQSLKSHHVQSTQKIM